MDTGKKVCMAGICDDNGCTMVELPCPHTVPALSIAGIVLMVCLVAVVGGILRGRR